MPPISLIGCNMEENNNVLTLNNISINEIAGISIDKIQDTIELYKPKTVPNDIWKQVIDFNTNKIYSYGVSDSSVVAKDFVLLPQKYEESKTYVRKESVDTDEYVFMSKNKREILLTENEK